MEEVLDYFDDKFKELQHSQARKSKREKSSSFRYTGNKFQYDFNEEVNEELHDLKNLVQEGSQRRSKASINSLIQKVEKRNKCIKIADRSGWDTVKEYLSDDLASDTEDEKKIHRAEKAALAKREINKQSFRYTPYNSVNKSPVTPTLASTVVIPPKPKPPSPRRQYSQGAHSG